MTSIDKYILGMQVDSQPNLNKSFSKGCTKILKQKIKLAQ